ncbi:MAG: biotin--[acetyl-CoA-carboxylase] ligase [Erysipelotrichaceae bacterium]|nr:biotin--[acetyl-CoA-carboxylase] ligase [Erysipelotrichaceae bacterium]
MENVILELLNKEKGNYISGQVMSNQLHVSRTTISKNVKKLIDKGYDIKSSTRKGYCLNKDSDIIFISHIQGSIPNFYRNIEYYDNIPSTNNLMKDTKYRQGDIVIAEHQSGGRGRNGRTFYSPKEKGIYFSFVIEPQLTVYDSLKITAICAVSLIKTIKKNYPLEPSIKWVNDIILNNKKVAGILCEAALEMNTAQIQKMVIGIGLNVHKQTFPDNLKDIATCLENECDRVIEREKIIIDFLNYFFDDYKNLSFIDDYKKYSCILHQNVMVYQNNQSYKAYVLDINDDASLKVLVNNEEKILNSGEITIRKAES